LTVLTPDEEVCNIALAICYKQANNPLAIVLTHERRECLVIRWVLCLLLIITTLKPTYFVNKQYLLLSMYILLVLNQILPKHCMSLHLHFVLSLTATKKTEHRREVMLSIASKYLCRRPYTLSTLN
jgi:hypothetical protein